MNFDGKQVNYAHWPVSPVSVLWPASRMTSKVMINAMPRVASGTSSMSFSGPWALFRWMDHASDMLVTQSGEMQWVYELDSRRANIGISGLTYKDRSLVALLRDFHCSGDY
ncbi:type VI secretion IcmF C-terminal domain-containing protein [Pantoea sp. Lu_F5_004]